MRYRSSEYPRPPQLWQYETVQDDLGLIRPGDTVLGFESIEQLDEFVPSLLRMASHTRNLIYASSGEYPSRVKPVDLDNRGRRHHWDWITAAKLPSLEMRPKKVRGIPFTGSFVNITATMVSNAVSDPNHIGQEQAELVLDADLFSTGRGIIGKTQRLVTYHHGTEHPYYPTVTYTKLEGDNADLAAQLLMHDSTTEERLAVIEAMSRVTLMGQPGSGRGS